MRLPCMVGEVLAATLVACVALVGCGILLSLGRR